VAEFGIFRNPADRAVSDTSDTSQTDTRNEQKRPLRVCYFGTYRVSYSRSQILLAGLRAHGVEVFEAHATLWRGIADRVAQASGGWKSPAFLLRVIRTYRRLLRAHARTPEYDVMLIGYPGQFDSFIGRWLSRRRGRPVALDVLMSLHLVAEERGLTDAHPRTGRLLFRLEKYGLGFPDILITENREYAEYIRAKYQLDPDRFRYLRHGADDRVFYPRGKPRRETPFRVSYHGTYVPSHGLETIIAAAVRLQNEADIEFHFYGTGPELDRISAAAREQRLERVHFRGFVSRSDLLEALAQSHICLGVFGTTRQARFTIQNKLWEGLAMGRCVISGEAPGVARTLKHREHVMLVERENPAALADAILELKQDPELRERLAAQGHQRFLEVGSISEVGRECKQILEELVAARERGN
jgi:glycosyltransferase involved in cell wall biosynthesis